MIHRKKPPGRFNKFVKRTAFAAAFSAALFGGRARALHKGPLIKPPSQTQKGHLPSQRVLRRMPGNTQAKVRSTTRSVQTHKGK